MENDEVLDERTLSDEVEPDQGSDVRMDDDLSLYIDVVDGEATEAEVDAAIREAQGNG